MFSHYINHLESSGALEGHWTLMVHECLMVAATLGCFHHWQRQVEPEDRDKPDWEKVPAISAGDFRQKYSPTLVLLGNAQHLTYTHPKLLGQCYDNVYHQGQLIRDLPAWGKPPTKEQTQKVYNQEHEEVVAQINNTLDLSDESLSHPMVKGIFVAGVQRICSRFLKFAFVNVCVCMRKVYSLLVRGVSRRRH